MNYQKHYDNLIKTRKEKCSFGNLEYWEKHHIVPKCLGGTNDQENLVLLTAREHCLAHWLLYKMAKNTNEKIRLGYAFSAMYMLDNNTKRSGLNKYYNLIKNIYVLNAKLNHTGRIVSEETRKKLSIANTGKKRSEEVRQKIRETNAGKELSEEVRQKISNATKGRKKSEEAVRKSANTRRGVKRSEETRRKMSIAQKKRFNKCEEGRKNV